MHSPWPQEHAWTVNDGLCLRALGWRPVFLLGASGWRRGGALGAPFLFGARQRGIAEHAARAPEDSVRPERRQCPPPPPEHWLWPSRTPGHHPAHFCCAQVRPSTCPPPPPPSGPGHVGGTEPRRPANTQPLSPRRQVPASTAFVTDSNRPPNRFGNPLSPPHYAPRDTPMPCPCHSPANAP